MTDQTLQNSKQGRGQRGRILTALGFGFFIDSAEDQALPMLLKEVAMYWYG